MRRNATLLVIALLLSACGSNEELVKPASLGDIDATVTVRPLWKKHTVFKGDDVPLQPVIIGKRLFVAGADGRFAALDRQSGALLWQAEAGVPFSAALGVARQEGEGLLFAGTLDGELLAFAARDGALRWRVTLTSSVFALPVYAAGRVIVRTNDGKTHALEAASGRLLWRDEGSVPALTLHGASRPLVRDGQVIVGQANGRLVSLDLDDGHREWEAVVAAPEGRSELERVVDIDADPILRDDVIYASAYQGRTVAVSPLSGRLLWTSDVPSHTGLVADEQTLYVCGHNDHVWALDRGNGALLWKLDGLFARRLTPPQVYHDFVVVGDGEGYLHVLSQFDGHLSGRYRVGSAPLMVRPQLVDDTLYVFDQAGRVQALTLTAH